MKTLHLTNSWSQTSGGIATHYRALMHAAERRGQQIRLIVPAVEDRVERIGNCGVIYHLKARRAPLNSNYRMLLPSSYLYPGSIIQRILLEERPDLIEVCDKYCLQYLSALLRARLMREVELRPTTVGFTCERMDDNVASYLGHSRIGVALSRWYMQRLYFAFFDHHIAVSQHTAGELRSASRGHPAERGVWLRCPGVDTSVFHASGRRPGARKRLLERLGRGKPTRLLIYAGRLVPEKNLPLLLQTMRLLRAQHPEAVLLIAGDGMERAAMERDAADLEDSVVFLGHIGGREELAEILAGCELFVHPNPKEPFGIAPLEAMASGLVLVAPNCGGVTEYANESNAMLAAPEADAFAQAVQMILRSPELLAEKSQTAQQTAEVFGVERMAEAFLELYETIDAVTRGRIPLSEAGAEFLSTAPAMVGTQVHGAFASLFKRAFRAWVRLNGRATATGSL